MPILLIGGSLLHADSQLSSPCHSRGIFNRKRRNNSQKRISLRLDKVLIKLFNFDLSKKQEGLEGSLISVVSLVRFQAPPPLIIRT